MKEKIIVVVAGVVVAMIIVFIMEAITGVIFPMPEGTDVANYVSNASAGMFILLILGYLAAAVGGGGVAAYLAPEKKHLYALGIGVFLTLAGIYNFMNISHPFWVEILSVAAFLGGSYWAGQYVIKNYANRKL